MFKKEKRYIDYIDFKSKTHMYFPQIVVSYGYDLSESPDWYKAEWERSALSRAGVSFTDWQSCRVKLGPGGQILTCHE